PENYWGVFPSGSLGWVMFISYRAGTVPADAPKGSVYYAAEKLSSGGDGETELITVRVRAFPPCGMTTGECGRKIINALEPLTLGTTPFDAEKHEGKLYKSYVDVSITYRLPVFYTRFFDMEKVEGRQVLMSELILTLDV
ncbi:MAG: hypothetical protein LUI61_03245, partial [Firmicutes bacterium]|nr:hypothetical protein [Bacillota bacterium]